MSGAPQPPDVPGPDLIDRIANALPVELRADYYGELRHCRSLPENDEMLHILRAMQFLVVLMVQAPEQMATERQRLEQIIADALKALRDVRQSSADTIRRNSISGWYNFRRTSRKESTRKQLPP